MRPLWVSLPLAALVAGSLGFIAAATPAISAQHFDLSDRRGYDDNGNGVADENDERYTIDAVVSRPGEQGNSSNEWHIRAGSLLILDGSGSFDPDGLRFLRF